MIKNLLEAGAKIGRKVPASFVLNDMARAKLSSLRERGFVMFDHLVDSPEFTSVQADLQKRIEQDMNFEFPCLAQSLIDETKHSDLITKSFRVPLGELERRRLTFDRRDIKDYRDLISRYRPSTLKLLMPNNFDYFSLWLDPIVTAVIEGYMGFKPMLREAYIRRNFPCSYRVMNHNWHRDTNHKHHLLKAFIFFNDCKIDTGAHRYIAGTTETSEFQDKIYYTDDEVEACYPVVSRDHIVSEGPAGTIILEDTRGLHKAGIPQRHYRDLGFAVFLPKILFANNSGDFAIGRDIYAQLSDSQKGYISQSNIIE